MLRWLAAIAGPIFAKELVEMGRRKRYFLNRIFYGLVLLFSLYVVWESNRWRLHETGRYSIRAMARMAEDLFLAVSWVQFGAVFVFVPVFLCGVIASEREERTLELLFTTQVTDREVVLGKLMSRLAALGMLILCGLPVLSMVMLFGGIDPQALGRVLASTFLAALYAGAHAIYFSAITKTAMGALVRTYWWMAIWLLAVPAFISLVVVWTSFRGRPGSFGMGCLGSIPFHNPLGSFVAGITPQLNDVLTNYVGEWYFPLTFLVPVIWSLFLVWRAISRLRLPPSPLVSLLKWIPLLSGLGKNWRGRARMRSQSRQVRADRTWLGYKVRNPLWLRSRLTRVYDREGHIGRIQWATWLVAGFFIGLLFFTEPRVLGNHGTGMGFLTPTWIAVAALTAIFAGTSLVGDRRRGFLELALTTPLSAREIIDGTFLSIWQHLKRLYWLPWILCLFFCLTGSAPLAGIAGSLAAATLFCSLLILHGMACSAASRSVPIALVLTFTFPLMTIVGIPMLLPIFRSGAGIALFFLGVVALVISNIQINRRTTPAGVACHLIAVHIILTSLATCWIWGYRDLSILVAHPGFWTIALLEGRLERTFGSVTWYSALAWYLAASILNLLYVRWWLIRHFDRLVERTGKHPTIGWPVFKELRSAKAPAQTMVAKL
jgi:ABC-type transport system involved in multi-copper enzyme maturation permease subunit